MIGIDEARSGVVEQWLADIRVGSQDRGRGRGANAQLTVDMSRRIIRDKRISDTVNFWRPKIADRPSGLRSRGKNTAANLPMNQVRRSAQNKGIRSVSRGARHDVLRPVVNDTGIGAIVRRDGIFVKTAALSVTKGQITGAIAIEIRRPTVRQSSE